MKRILLSAIAATLFVAPMAAYADPPRAQYNDYRNNDRDRGGWDRNDNRNDRNDRFDNRRHNGYYTGRTWHYGPPPASAYRAHDFRLGYKPWAKGERLGYYNGRYVEVDYRARHLKAPPRGYHYVKDDKGDIILAAVATGIIAAIIAGSN